MISSQHRVKRSACSPTSWVLHLGVDLDSATNTDSWIFFQVWENLSYKDDFAGGILIRLATPDVMF